MELSNSHKSLLFSLGAVLFWSTVATAFKLSLNEMSYATLLFYSSATSAIILFLFLFFNSKKKLANIFSKRNLFRNILLGLANPFLYYLVLFKAYSLLPAQEAQPLNFTWPIIITLFSAIFLKQKISKSVYFGLLLAFLGVFTIATRGEIAALKFGNILGVSLAFGSSFIWATYWTMNMLDKRSATEKLFAGFFFGTIYSAIYVFFYDTFNVNSLHSLLGPAYIGIFEMGITFLLWMKGLELSKDKGKTSLLAYLTPFFSLVFITLVLGERLLISSIVGLILIISGVLLPALHRKSISSR